MAKKPVPSIDRPTLEYFDFQGPHQVAIGRTDGAGLRGLVFAPVSGSGRPVVAVGHGWLQPAHRYSDTMRFLASWGIIAVAPDTERGPVPSHGGLARDLNTSLELICAGRLGNGRVRPDPGKLGVLGHSIGGGAAVLAAAHNDHITAVVTVTAADTTPSSVEAASRVTVPSLHLVGANDSMAGEGTDSDGARIAAAWAGPSQLRTLKKVDHFGLPEGKHWTTAIVGSDGVKRAQKVTRVLATAFFVRTLLEQDQLADDLDKKMSGTTIEDLAELREAQDA